MELVISISSIFILNCKKCMECTFLQSLFMWVLFFLVELDHRIDFELREGLVESRYWSAVTSHTAYWSSLDVALFLLTFMYKHEQEDNAKPSLDPVWVPEGHEWPKTIFFRSNVYVKRWTFQD